MPCYHPITAWYSKDRNKSGKRSLVFSPNRAEDPDRPIEVSCGQCIGCRIDRSRQWAIRCIHEASLYDKNCFITLTFNDEALKVRDNPYTVDVRDFQLFMKRLRKRFPDQKIRFFHCGEYGEKYGRPHYHACLFNFDFEDKELFRVANGNRLYVSETLQELWPYGFNIIGDVTLESAAYVARYIMKKITGDRAESHYMLVDGDTGEYLGHKKPEYITMSRRPGIAHDWYMKYQDDTMKDFLTINGKKMKIPKYYDKLLEKTRPYEFDLMKEKRVENAIQFRDNNTPERLKVREEVQQAKLERLIRPID